MPTTQWVTTLAFLITLLFGVQTLSLVSHEARHAASFANKRGVQSLIAVSDDCSLCAAQHAQTDTSFVQREPSKTSFFPPAILENDLDPLVQCDPLYANPRAPPLA
jgi:hypothetical protein